MKLLVFIFNVLERYREDGTEKECYSDSGGKSGGQKEKLAYSILAAAILLQYRLVSSSQQVTANTKRRFNLVVIDEAFARGSKDSTRFGLELFGKLGLQLLLVTPMQKLDVIEHYVRRWVAEVEKRFSKHLGIDIEYQDVQFKTMGWQRLPVGLCIPTADGLAFPPLKNSLVIFGFGYGIQMLRSVKWLSACQIHYWGDIDTHGFKILSQIRHYFPNTRSFLMDETTLLLSKDFWGVESTPAADNELAHLTPEEQSLYQGLKQNRWAVNLRLEQERIPFEHVQDSLKRFR